MFLEQNDSTFAQTLPFGNLATRVETDTLILNAIVQYVLSTKRCSNYHFLSTSLRLSRFFDLSRKVFLITFKFS